MDPAEEQGAKDRALKNSVQHAERSLSAEGAHRLRDSFARRVDTFHGTLPGDPPARVEPGVQPQSQVKAEKAKSHRCDPVKTGWLASCVAALVALGLLYCSMQAVWKRAAIEAPENFCLRRVSDYKEGAHITSVHKDQVYDTRPEEKVQFKFLSVDERGPLGGGGLDGGEQNNAEMVKDLSNFEWLGTHAANRLPKMIL